uniref:Uncharacterized protein n=1 Tax=Anopheles atroparvus TaxID=41427 RepID=A0A182J2M4_ANOAO
MQLNPSNKRRESKTPTVKRRMSRHGSVLIETAPRELPWDLIDRLLVPIICCHAAAILISGVLNLLRISQVSAFVLFILFTILTVSAALVYHSLKVGLQTKPNQSAA